jgi:hypothetical protein
MTTTLPNRLAALCVGLVLLSAFGCKQDAAPEAPAPAAMGSMSKAAVASQPSPKVAKIVFVGKQEACDCTRARIDGSLAALESALSGAKTIPVERLQADANEIEVKQYNDMSPIMVLPAVYLLDGEGKLVKMLQGELTSEQIVAALGSS